MLYNLDEKVQRLQSILRKPHKELEIIFLAFQS